MKKEKTYSRAPLPFVGQKRMFVSEFKKILKHFDDKTIFVDLFGGSGLLSHITKRERPDAVVIYNDHDNYRGRLENIGRTNTLLEISVNSRDISPQSEDYRKNARSFP